jgi:hypothetical protein
MFGSGTDSLNFSAEEAAILGEATEPTRSLPLISLLQTQSIPPLPSTLRFYSFIFLLFSSPPLFKKNNICTLPIT